MKKLLSCVILAGLLAGCTDTEPAGESASMSKADDSTVRDEAIVETKPVSAWQYNESKDEMRDSVDYTALLESSNKIELDFPYNGGTTLGLLLRESSNFGQDIMIVVEKGNLGACIAGCSANFKFDDGEIVEYNLSGGSDSMGNVLFIQNQKDVKAISDKLKSSKIVFVEVSFFDQGLKQFKFDVSGLEWNHF